MAHWLRRLPTQTGVSTIGVRDEFAVLMQGKSHERHDVGQETLRRRSAHLGLLQGFVGTPQLLRCP